MKKTFFLIILMHLLFSCISDRKTEIPYRSETIEESKKKKAFINSYSFEYEIKPKIGRLLIQEAWIEKEWGYKNQKGELNYTGKINFIVKFKENSFNPENAFDFSVSTEKKALKSPFGGGGEINDGACYDVTNYKKEIDSFRLYFMYKGDTIPVLFKKKL